MKFKSFATIAVTVACATFAITSAQAAVTVYELPFIGTWDGYASDDIDQTFSGNGYVGMYEVEQNFTDAFVALFGVEGSNYSRTHAQVGIAGLGGMTINSAVLSFDILDGNDDIQNVQVTGSSGNGALGYQWDAPGSNYGDDIFDVTAGANALDITGLLAASVAAGDAWFNLHLQGLINQVYLFTYAGAGEDIDRANVRLTVDYGPRDVIDTPAPAGLGLLLTGLLGMGLYRRRMR